MGPQFRAIQKPWFARGIVGGMVRTLTILTLVFCVSGFCRAEEAPLDRLLVGGDAAYPPFEWLDQEGRPQGFNIELIRLLAEPAGVEVDFRLGDWSDTLAALDAGQIDVVPMFVSDERRQRYRFTNTYFYQTHALFGLPDSEPLDEIDSLDGSTLVVEAGSDAQNQLREQYPELVPRLTANTRLALQMVVEGGGDYALLAAPVAQELIEREGWAIERKSPPMWPRGYAFATSAERTALNAWLQSRLVETIGNGQYLDLYGQWSDRLEPGRGAAAGYLRIALIGLVIVGLGGLGFVIWNLSLRRQVAHRTGKVVKELENRKQAERKARDLARREPITGLYNARYFCGKCGEMLKTQASDTRGELMLIRLLEGETVVRTFGYQVAEKMIVGFSEALRRTFDEPIAHLGRGTFGVFEPAGTVNDRLDRLEEAISRDETLVHPRFIAGSACYPDDDTDINELLHKAELALAESMSQRCRWTAYRSDLQVDPVDLKIVQSVHDDRIQGLSFAIQPQIRLADSRTTAGELLARWHHPELGPLEPGRFIPLLESAGLTGRLTAHAFDDAFALLRALDGREDSFQTSVNVSVRDLVDPLFHQRIGAKLADYRFDAAVLKLEVTETGLISDRVAVRENLEHLAELGATISIDDFGTGYSTLDYISRFPISEVKIDRSFVIRMLDSPRDMSIVRSTIALAHEMDIKVVGEGAETAAHLQALGDLGCDLAQGWAVGYPQGRDAFVDSLRKRGETEARQH